MGEFSYGFWNFATRLVGGVNTFLVIFSLTVYEYGSFQLLLASYAGASMFLTIGGGVIRNDILRFEAEGRSPESKKLFYELLCTRAITGLILWAIVFFGAPYLSFKYGPDYITLIRIISFLFLHDAFLTSVITVLEMRKKFNIIASRTFLAKTVQLFVLSYFFLFKNIDLHIVVASLVVSMFVTLLLLLPSFFESSSIWKGVKSSTENFLLKILMSYGKWEVLQPIVGRFTSLFEAWAIKFFINTEAVAIFSIAQTLVNTVAGFFPVKTLATLVPLETKSEDKLKRIYTYGTKYLMALSILMGLVAFVVVPPVISIFFAKYTISLPYFNVLLLTLPILSITAVASIFLIALRRQKFLFFQKILKNIVAIPLYVLLLPALGLWGLVIHNFILLSIMTTSLYLYLRGTRPKLFVKWYDTLRFGKEDRIFLNSILGKLKTRFF
jgi:O-antigen/teichoic acid export membrane protein